MAWIFLEIRSHLGRVGSLRYLLLISLPVRIIFPWNRRTSVVSSCSRRRKKNHVCMYREWRVRNRPPSVRSKIKKFIIHGNFQRLECNTEEYSPRWTFPSSQFVSLRSRLKNVDEEVIAIVSEWYPSFNRVFYFILLVRSQWYIYLFICSFLTGKETPISTKSDAKLLAKISSATGLSEKF